MRMPCPRCGRQTECRFAVVITDDSFLSRENDWKLTCPCGLDAEGRLTTRQRLVGTALFLAPVSVAWAVFPMVFDSHQYDAQHLLVFFALSWPDFLSVCASASAMQAESRAPTSPTRG